MPRFNSWNPYSQKEMHEFKKRKWKSWSKTYRSITGKIIIPMRYELIEPWFPGKIKQMSKIDILNHKLKIGALK